MSAVITTVTRMCNETQEVRMRMTGHFEHGGNEERSYLMTKGVVYWVGSDSSRMEVSDDKPMKQEPLCRC